MAASRRESRAGLFGQSAHEYRVAVGGWSAQFVMKMRDNNFAEVRAPQQVEKHNGVDPAGDTGDGRRGAGKVGHAFEETRQEVGRLFHRVQAAVIFAAPK